ncbi:GEN1 Holliday junction resolvase homolog [Caenorhabditis elegans]|uniref:GEN1 Holliday junction resolvase homolog n=1 Tax=Caenorhabditis elegans TaxID=6239 RepID=Q22418_CAEEL|nr:GEN1 Holliday junction resolvase homolog [Caenorhabditis elegans]CCD65214.1 GEN1 Holliday junction resolvase homolog [Caenorhabditis elegans]|eukprot:NP_498361.1 GEN1 Holliday junction resolvase homolog [Caenorhabditis elegans]
MTINGIWEWANHVVRKVPNETMRDKTLSIDGHIWLYESLKGCEAHHQQTPNSYLVTFFTRIQRLLELKIIPIVVFDNINASSSAHESKDQNEFVPRKRRSFGDSPFTNLVDHVYKTNALLTELGIKVIIAPGDGEAQCARLEDLGVTSGCITTDFDYFLFGGKNLYRFDFTAGTSSTACLHDIMHLSLGRMFMEKKVSRPHLISTAILLGCDYFQRGVQNIGIVSVFDILGEFGDDGNEEIDPHVILDRFASYVREEIPARSEDTQRKLRLRRKKYNFPVGFPNCDAVHNAITMYLRPPVSSEIPKIIPRAANFQQVAEIMMKECGWPATRTQKELALSIRRKVHLTTTVAQTRIPDFFAATKSKNFTPIVEPCESLEDYISANNTWMRKRKRSESPQILQHHAKRQVPDRKRSVKIRAFKPYPTDVIELGDSD